MTYRALVAYCDRCDISTHHELSDQHGIDLALKVMRLIGWLALHPDDDDSVTEKELCPDCRKDLGK